MDPLLPSTPIHPALTGARDLFAKHSAAFLEATEPAECERLALLLSESGRDVLSSQLEDALVVYHPTRAHVCDCIARDTTLSLCAAALFIASCVSHVTENAAAAQIRDQVFEEIRTSSTPLASHDNLAICPGASHPVIFSSFLLLGKDLCVAARAPLVSKRRRSPPLAIDDATNASATPSTPKQRRRANGPSQPITAPVAVVAPAVPAPSVQSVVEHGCVTPQSVHLAMIANAFSPEVAKYDIGVAYPWLHAPARVDNLRMYDEGMPRFAFIGHVVTVDACNMRIRDLEHGMVICELRDAGDSVKILASNCLVTLRGALSGLRVRTALSYARSPDDLARIPTGADIGRPDFEWAFSATSLVEIIAERDAAAAGGRPALLTLAPATAGARTGPCTSAIHTSHARLVNVRAARLQFETDAAVRSRKIRRDLRQPARIAIIELARHPADYAGSSRFGTHDPMAIERAMTQLLEPAPRALSVPARDYRLCAFRYWLQRVYITWDRDTGNCVCRHHLLPGARMSLTQLYYDAPNRRMSIVMSQKWIISFCWATVAATEETKDAPSQYLSFAYFTPTDSDLPPALPPRILCHYDINIEATLNLSPDELLATCGEPTAEVPECFRVFFPIRDSPRISVGQLIAENAMQGTLEPRFCDPVDETEGTSHRHRHRRPRSYSLPSGRRSPFAGLSPNGITENATFLATSATFRHAAFPYPARSPVSAEPPASPFASLTVPESPLSMPPVVAHAPDPPSLSPPPPPATARAALEQLDLLERPYHQGFLRQMQVYGRTRNIESSLAPDQPRHIDIVVKRGAVYNTRDLLDMQIFNHVQTTLFPMQRLIEEYDSVRPYHAWSRDEFPPIVLHRTHGSGLVERAAERNAYQFALCDTLWTRLCDTPHARIMEPVERKAFDRFLVTARSNLKYYPWTYSGIQYRMLPNLSFYITPTSTGGKRCPACGIPAHGLMADDSYHGYHAAATCILLLERSQSATVLRDYIHERIAVVNGDVDGHVYPKKHQAGLRRELTRFLGRNGDLDRAYFLDAQKRQWEKFTSTLRLLLEPAGLRSAGPGRPRKRQAVSAISLYGISPSMFPFQSTVADTRCNWLELLLVDPCQSNETELDADTPFVHREPSGALIFPSRTFTLTD